MMASFINIDISPESKDPCKNLLIEYLKCCENKTQEERRNVCFKFGSDYLDCKTDPKILKKFAVRTVKDHLNPAK